jgi:hypothetical protein
MFHVCRLSGLYTSDRSVYLGACSKNSCGGVLISKAPKLYKYSSDKSKPILGTAADYLRVLYAIEEGKCSGAFLGSMNTSHPPISEI